jgi:hypothetical protein
VFRSLKRASTSVVSMPHAASYCLQHDQIPLSCRSKIFGTSRIPGEHQDTLVTNPVQLSDYAHVVVCIGTTLWKVPVQAPGWTASVQELYSAFTQALTASAAQAGGPYSDPPVALLTSDSRPRWARARGVLQQHPVNARSLCQIEDALVWLNLHPGVSSDSVQAGAVPGGNTPYTSLQEGEVVSQRVLNTERPLMNAMVKQVWHDMGDGRRQWWDKSVSFTVLPSGHVGTTVEHTFADAPVPAHLWGHLFLQEARLAGTAYVDISARDSAGQHQVLGSHHPAAAQRLDWDIPGWNTREHAASLQPPAFRLVRSESLGWTGVGLGRAADDGQTWRSGEWDVVGEGTTPAAARSKEQWEAPLCDAEAAAADAAEDAMPSAPEHLLAHMLGARRRFNALVSQVHMRSTVFKRWGKNTMKAWRMSPDAFMQAALQLASLALHGRVVLTYESASTRSFEGGRTGTVRSASGPAAAMARAVLTSIAAGPAPGGAGLLLEATLGGAVPPSQFAAALTVLSKCSAWRVPPGAAVLTASELTALLRTAASHHSALTRAAMRGQGVDRHMLGLKLAAVTTGRKVPPFFSDPATHAGDKFELSTSQPPLAQEMLQKGAPNFTPDLRWGEQLGMGGGFGPTASPGVGVSYHILPDSVYLHMSARSATPALQCVRLEECVLASMLVLGGILQASAATAPSAPAASTRK